MLYHHKKTFCYLPKLLYQRWICLKVPKLRNCLPNVITLHVSFRSTCRIFQIAYEGDFWCLCTVTFWQKKICTRDSTIGTKSWLDYIQNLDSWFFYKLFFTDSIHSFKICQQKQMFFFWVNNKHFLLHKHPPGFGRCHC